MPTRLLTALLLLAPLIAACSEPMERSGPPESAATDNGDEAKTAKIETPTIRDAEGLSPRQPEEVDAVPFFDPRDSDAAAAEFEMGNATPPDGIDDAAIVGRATGSFSAPGANETAWMVEGEDGVRIVLVSIGGMTLEAALPDALASPATRIVATPDTNMDGLTELLLYAPSTGEDAPARADHISLRSGELEQLESWNNLLPVACQEGERTGIILLLDEKSGEITEAPFTDTC